MCRDTTDVGGGVVREGRGIPPRKYIRLKEGRVGRNKYKYITLSARD